MPQINSNKTIGLLFSAVVLIAAAGLIVWMTAPNWLGVSSSKPIEPAAHSNSQDHANGESTVVKISSQTRANLSLTSAPAQLETYWRKIETTGMIVDRPGFTDQGVTTPVDCFVSKIHAYEGDVVKPGDKLFTLRLTSEYLQKTQSDYFKALHETEIIKTEIERLSGLADRGVIPEKRIIQLNQDLNRQKVEVQANRQDLITRGLDQQQLDQIADGNFIKTIDVIVPPADNSEDTFLELQDLKVELGEKAQAGQMLAMLANHNHLYINGHGFKKEANSIGKAAEAGWNIDVEFIENAVGNWPEPEQPLKIRHLSNTVDLESRTFDFFIPLTNQSRGYQRDGRKFVSWRFRPGQRVRIQIPVEEIKDVFVVPIEAVISKGPENFVFQQNGELFNRIEVHVLHRDRKHAVIAEDGGIRAGFYIASNSAAALNRILKAQSASGENMEGFHVHADGSVHANH